jgi:hypothetical protein
VREAQTQEAGAAARRRTAARRPAPVQSPDSRDNNQSARRPSVSHVSPDASDVTARSPRQQAHDREVTAEAVKAERLAYLREHRKTFSLRRFLETATASQRPNVVSVSDSQARLLRRQGKQVYSGHDVGATLLPKDDFATSGVARAGEATVLGIIRDPKHALPATAKGFKDAALGAPGAIVKTIVDPKGTLSEQAKDYKRRYGGINSPGGVDRMARRVSKEGAAPELFDATMFGVPVAKGIDLGLGRLGRAGRLGARAERTTTAARPGVRTSGGTTLAQDVPKGLVAAARARRRDALAAKAIQREIDHADGQARRRAAREVEGAGKGQAPLTDARKKGEVDAVVREAHAHGEVVPTRMSLLPGRRIISDRKIAKVQRKAYARTKGRRLEQQRREQRDQIFRGSNRRLAGLSRWERRAFKTAQQTGAHTPEAARAVIERRIRIIEKARAEGRDVASSSDELPTLRRLHEHAEEAFTPRLAAVVRAERSAAERDAIGDPALGATATERAATSEARRLAVQARVVGEARRGTPVREAVRRAGDAIRVADRHVAKARAVRDRAAQRAAAATGYAQAGVDRAKRSIDHQITRAENAVEIHRRAAANHLRRVDRARQDGTRAGHQAHADAALERMQRAQERLDALRGNRTAARPEYRRAVAKARRRADEAQRAFERAQEAAGAARETAGVVDRQKRAGVDLIGAEPLEAFHARVRGRAKELGLEEPGYHPSRKRTERRFAPFTIGGARRAKPDRRYKGKVFEAGRESNDLTTYTQGRAQNIKRAHNWGLISDTIHEHALPWGRGGKVGATLDELDRRGIDPDTVRLVDMDAFDRAAHEAGLEGGSVRQAPDMHEAELHAALTKAVHGVAVGGHGELMLTGGADLEAGAGRVMVLPKAVADEIVKDTKPSHAALRALEIAKTKQARIMLGLSPAWLQFQVAANGLQSLAATKALPHEWVIANVKWWRGLSDDEKRALSPVVGIGSFHDSTQTVHLGASTTSGIVDSYRAFKAHPFWHSPRKPLRGGAISQLNPLDTLFRLDNAQNNFFRRAVLYNSLKRDAYDRMGASIAGHQRIMDRVLGTAGKDVKQQIRQMIASPADLEKAAEHLHDFLGDYQTYTARERRVLGRNIMFYGYLRWSLRFAFYTMPVKHPVMTAIIGQLGDLQTREVRELLGGDELPFDLGKLYFAKGGKLKSVDLTRANPILNAVTQAKVGEQGFIRGALAAGLGVLPPLYGAAADVLFAKSAFRDRPLKVEGETTARPNKTGGDRISDMQSLEIFGKDMLDLASPYRAAEQVAARGRPMSDNSLLFRQRYTQFKDPQRRLDVLRGEKLLSTGQRLQQQFVPLVPQPSDDVARAAAVRRARGIASKPVAVRLTPAQAAETKALMDEARSSSGGGGAAASKSEIKALLREAAAGGG